MTDKRPDRPSWLRYSGIGVEFASALLVFSLIGYWVDRHWGTGPWGLLIGAGLGLIGGTYNLIRKSLAAFQDEETARQQRKRDRSAGPRG